MLTLPRVIYSKTLTATSPSACVVCLLMFSVDRSQAAARLVSRHRAVSAQAGGSMGVIRTLLRAIISLNERKRGYAKLYKVYNKSISRVSQVFERRLKPLGAGAKTINVGICKEFTHQQ